VPSSCGTSRCTIVQQISAVFNHALIFNTDEQSFHGFPEPLYLPPERLPKKPGFVLLHRGRRFENCDSLNRLSFPAE